MNRDFNKFNEIFRARPSEKKSLTILSSKGNFLRGIFNKEAEEESIPELKGKQIEPSSITPIYNLLSKKYNVHSIQNIDEDDLIEITDKLWDEDHNNFQDAHCYAQVRSVYEKLFSLKSSKKTLLYGDKNKNNFIPQSNFLLDIFKSKIIKNSFGKRNILFALVDELNDTVDLMVLSFSGQELFRFSSIEKEQVLIKGISGDFLKRDTVKRILARLKDKYKNPFHAIFITKSVWIRCLEKQERYGKKAAWRYLLQANKSRRSSREVLLLEPEEWTLRFSMFLKSLF